MEIIEILLNYDKELVNLELIDDEHEEYALHTAARHNQFKVIELLLRYKLICPTMLNITCFDSTEKMLNNGEIAKVILQSWLLLNMVLQSHLKC